MDGQKFLIESGSSFRVKTVKGSKITIVYSKNQGTEAYYTVKSIPLCTMIHSELQGQLIKRAMFLNVFYTF